MTALPSDGDFSPFLQSWSAEERKTLLEAADASDYALADWLEALVAFDAWLAAKNEKRRPWVGMIGYVACCTHLNAPGIALGNLKIIVNQSLTDFGFLLDSEAQI